MRSPTGSRPLLGLALLALVGCTAADARPTASRILAATSGPEPVRLSIVDDRVVEVVSPIDHRELPMQARTTSAALLPDGELTFCGSERGRRGAGYRVEKQYTSPPHSRSILVDGDGKVLERWHTVPIPEVPQHVLATALRHGQNIVVARIVSGTVTEEYWQMEVTDRRGYRWLVEVSLAGDLLRHHRRLCCIVDS